MWLRFSLCYSMDDVIGSVNDVIRQSSSFYLSPISAAMEIVPDVLFSLFAILWCRCVWCSVKLRYTMPNTTAEWVPSGTEFMFQSALLLEVMIYGCAKLHRKNDFSVFNSLICTYCSHISYCILNSIINYSLWGSNAERDSIESDRQLDLANEIND